MFRINLRQLGTTAVSAAALMTMALIAPGAAFAQRTITIVIPEEPDSLDNCNSARSAVGRVIRQNVNETLIELDPNDSSLKPRLATSWKQVDATTWRFNLRKGIKYSDGTPLTPEAISSSVDKALNPKLDCNARTKMFSGFKIKVVKVDDATIDIVTPQPDPILPVRMTTLTIGYPNEPIRILNNSVGTGPYMIDRYTANSEVVLKRNPHYWGKKPQLDGARYVWRKESAVAAAMVKVGEAHLATNIAFQDATDREDGLRLSQLGDQLPSHRIAGSAAHRQAGAPGAQLRGRPHGLAWRDHPQASHDRHADGDPAHCRTQSRARQAALRIQPGKGQEAARRSQGGRCEGRHANRSRCVVSTSGKTPPKPASPSWPCTRRSA